MMAPLGTDQLDTETRHSLHNTNRVSNIKDEDIIRANYNFINTAVQLADGRTNEETNEQKKQLSAWKEHEHCRLDGSKKRGHAEDKRDRDLQCKRRQ